MSQRRQLDAPRAAVGRVPAGRWQSVGGWLALAFVGFAAFLILDPLRGMALAGVGSSSSAAAPEPGAGRGGPTGGGPIGGGSGASGTSGASGGVVEAGRGLYTAQCASCHGPQGQGTEYGPSLVGAGAAGADFYLRTGRMPLSAPGQPVTRHETRLSDEQIAALTAVVAGFGPGPDIPQVQGGGDVGDGAELYIANCAACHGATGAGNAIGGGNIAANLAHADATEVVEAIRIGPGAMPQFRFSPDEEAAIAAYVKQLQDEPTPGGLAIGGLGAVAEGFIAIAVGLVLLVLVAMFVGRRSHEGEPPTSPVG